MRALIERDLADAAVAGLSADRRFATAYNAALLAANMAIACAGYRVTAKVGHHKVSFESTRLAIGSAADNYADYFQDTFERPPYDRQRSGARMADWVTHAGFREKVQDLRVPAASSSGIEKEQS